MSEEEFDEYNLEERVLDKLEHWVKYNKPITRKQAEETIDFICEQDNVIERKDKEIERLNKIIENTIKYCKESNITLKSHYFMDVIKLLKGEKI